MSFIPRYQSSAKVGALAFRQSYAPMCRNKTLPGDANLMQTIEAAYQRAGFAPFGALNHDYLIELGIDPANFPAAPPPNWPQLYLIWTQTMTIPTGSYTVPGTDGGAVYNWDAMAWMQQGVFNPTDKTTSFTETNTDFMLNNHDYGGLQSYGITVPYGLLPFQNHTDGTFTVTGPVHYGTLTEEGIGTFGQTFGYGYHFDGPASFSGDTTLNVLYDVNPDGVPLPSTMALSNPLHYDNTWAFYAPLADALLETMPFDFTIHPGQKNLFGGPIGWPQFFPPSPLLAERACGTDIPSNVVVDVKSALISKTGIKSYKLSSYDENQGTFTVQPTPNNLPYGLGMFIFDPIGTTAAPDDGWQVVDLSSLTAIYKYWKLEVTMI